MKTIVIAGYPGVGKSRAVEELQLQYKVSDSDSSQFSREEGFPQNYIAHIASLIEEEYDYVFVSTHKVVRDALKDAGIPFVVVHPDLDIKDEYIQRFIGRGSPAKFVQLMDEKWSEWITEIKNDTSLAKYCIYAGDYLVDHLDEIKDITLRTRPFVTVIQSDRNSTVSIDAEDFARSASWNEIALIKPSCSNCTHEPVCAFKMKHAESIEVVNEAMANINAKIGHDQFAAEVHCKNYIDSTAGPPFPTWNAPTYPIVDPSKGPGYYYGNRWLYTDKNTTSGITMDVPRGTTKVSFEPDAMGSGGKNGCCGCHEEGE